MALQGRVLAARYELGPRLGAGGMAGVYQATDQVLDRTVAVKVLGPPYDQDPDFVDQFRHEARMAAGLGHPNVVAIFDSASEGDLHYIVMEYVQGQTLAELLRRHGRLPPGLAAEVAHRVCLALEAAHERGLVHRDIKPVNVMVDRWMGARTCMPWAVCGTSCSPARRRFVATARWRWSHSRSASRLSRRRTAIPRSARSWTPWC